MWGQVKSKHRGNSRMKIALPECASLQWGCWALLVLIVYAHHDCYVPRTWSLPWLPILPHCVYVIIPLYIKEFTSWKIARNYRKSTCFKFLNLGELTGVYNVVTANHRPSWVLLVVKIQNEYLMFLGNRAKSRENQTSKPCILPSWLYTRCNQFWMNVSDD